jgi:hypothetical protein
LDEVKEQAKGRKRAMKTPKKGCDRAVKRE